DEVTVTENELKDAMFSDRPDLNVLVAEVDGQLVGCAAWFPTYTPWIGRRAIWLADLYVKPEYRRQGHGEALIRTLAELCIRDGYHRIDWKMVTTNADATAFYKSLGATIPENRIMWTMSADNAAALCHGNVTRIPLM
ncbi:MAG: GNAT family N-acetyltransferase, partial [Candidatus Dormibacteraceae bacterium]